MLKCFATVGQTINYYLDTASTLGNALGWKVGADNVARDGWLSAIGYKDWIIGSSQPGLQKSKGGCRLVGWYKVTRPSNGQKVKITLIPCHVTTHPLASVNGPRSPRLCFFQAQVRRPVLCSPTGNARVSWKLKWGKTIVRVFGVSSAGATQCICTNTYCLHCKRERAIAR